METYNVIVIGAGSGGLSVAAGAAGLGARTALVESGPMGGDCLNFGCVPSKALISAAAGVALSRRGGLGLEGAAPRFTWAAVAAHVHGAIAAIAPHDSVERFRSLGVDVVQGRGRLLPGRQVEVTLQGGATRRLAAKSVVLATGSTPAVPPIPGLAEAGYVTNEQVFSMAELPARMLVVGGGAIGAELGQALGRLGSRVTLIEALPQILPKEDADAAEVVARAMAADGVEVITGHKVERVERQGGAKRVHFVNVEGGAARTVDVDEILVAVGRVPATAGLGLEEAGVAFGRGGVTVDDRLRTTAPGVYACGDVTGPYQFTHAANQQARVVVQNALLPITTRINYRVLPWCTFTAPEVARVGLNESEAREQGRPHNVLNIPFSGNDRAVCEGSTEGFLKVLTPPKGDDILGATLVCPHAGDMIHEVALAMHARLGLKALSGTVHAYPTRAEIMRRAGDEWRKTGFTPRLRRILQAYFRWRRR